MVDKFISMWKVRELADKVTNVVMNYTEIEGKVREATNDDPWGPTGPLMQELAHSTFTYEHFPEVMSMLWKRMLQDNKTNWRRTYKSLLLLNYLVRNGSERVVTSAREHIYDLRSLENYTFTDENGKDTGINVRHKVRELIDFIQDDEKLRDERKKAKKNKDKYIGMSSDAMGMKFNARGYNENWNTPRADDRNWYSDERAERRYDDDDCQYEGEREDSENDSPGPTARYRDKDRTSPPEIVPEPATNKTINVNLKPTVKQSQPSKTISSSKKIDMGAASNFGKPKDFGIHSPTHRDTPTEDLFSPNNNTAIVENVSSALDDVFKTCSPTNQRTAPSNNINSKTDDDDFADFNPRANEDNQEFGDFESAFGAAPINTLPTTALPTSTIPIIPPATIATKKDDDFADFAAFTGSEPTTTPSLNANSQLQSDLLFGGETLKQDPLSLYANHNTSSLSGADLLSGLGDLTINTGGLNAASSKDGSYSKHLLNAIEQFRTIMKQNDNITSEKDIVKIENTVLDILKYLPGPSTPEKLLGVDTDLYDWTNFADTDYRSILDEIGSRFNSSWPVYDGKWSKPIFDLYQIDHNCRFVFESISNLLNLINRKTPGCVDLLTSVVYHESRLASVFVEMSSQHFCDPTKMDISNIAKQQLKDQLLQLLISLPNKVANAFQTETPTIFLPKKYGRLLTQQFIKSLYFISKANQIHGGKYFEFKYLAQILSRIIINYHVVLKSDLTSALRILSHLTRDEFQKKSINEVFALLDRNAMQPVTMLMLEGDIMLFDVIDSSIFKSQSWKYCITENLPLLSVLTENRHVTKLIEYIATASGQATQEFEKKTLINLLFELLNNWSNKSATHKGSMQQHIYVTKLVISTVQHLNLMAQLKLVDSERFEVKKKLFDGLKHHLESSNINIRQLGMLTAEIIIGLLETDPKVEKLKFEYVTLDDASKELLDTLNSLKVSETFLSTLPKEFSTDDSNNFESIIEEFFRTDLSEYEITFEKPVVQPIKCTEEDGTQPNITNNIQEPMESEELLDSDDDLVPYDMSNDIPIIMEKRARFLQDLRDALISTDDPDVFQSSLECSTTLIKEQLASNDTTLAIELLSLFLTLQKKFYFEGAFEELKCINCVTISTIYPKECAEYLCKEFHSDDGSYSIALRMTMLTILAQTAKALSGSQEPTPEPPARPTKKTVRKLLKEEENIRLKEAKRIIRDRIKLKTRYYFSKRSNDIHQPQGSVNRFSAVAGSFFFPLIRGARKDRIISIKTSQSRNQNIDSDLLVHFLNTLTAIIVCAEHAPILRQMAQEIFEMYTFIRFSADAMVRLSVLQLVGSVLCTVPRDILRNEFFNEMVEVKNWLEECTNCSIIRGEKNEYCREMATKVLSLCIQILME
ncbi:telomere length regulation protein TEL2 homolog isoform X2 [Hermetia illucens]|uniref:telomere length regulation protein TEL2 homolog isoform X2 n=1 Tax=Hermetia illucens TaxID=343691 RepID=UPI0018CC780A|nr:telomere length regulation protein TEL2 homolog isoform X2 [Hermetia illucens]